MCVCVYWPALKQSVITPSPVICPVSDVFPCASLSPPPHPGPAGVDTAVIIGVVVAVAIVILIILILSASFIVLVCVKVITSESSGEKGGLVPHSPTEGPS